MNNKITLDIAKNCEAPCGGVSVASMKEILNWYSVGTYEDYKPLLGQGNENYLYCLSKFGNAVFALKVNKSGLITAIIYYKEFNNTKETRAAIAILTRGKFNFNF